MGTRDSALAGLDIGESDRQSALKMALDLHRTGSGIARSAEGVILTAARFLRFIHEPDAAIAEATLVRAARSTVAVLYTIANAPQSQHLTSQRQALVDAAKRLDDALRGLGIDETEK